MNVRGMRVKRTISHHLDVHDYCLVRSFYASLRNYGVHSGRVFAVHSLHVASGRHAKHAWLRRLFCTEVRRAQREKIVGRTQTNELCAPRILSGTLGKH